MPALVLDAIGAVGNYSRGLWTQTKNGDRLVEKQTSKGDKMQPRHRFPFSASCFAVFAFHWAFLVAASSTAFGGYGVNVVQRVSMFAS